MNRLTIDDSLAKKLCALTGTTELCDGSGRVLGRFVPMPDMSDWEPVSPDVTEEELDRREKSTEWYTTEQVLDHLHRSERL